MKKSLLTRDLAIRQLNICAKESEKLARQINRKLESLAQWNKAKAAAQEALVKLCDDNQNAGAKV